jgi:hypothetical protein
MCEKGRRGAQSAAYALERLDAYLSACQLGMEPGCHGQILSVGFFAAMPLNRDGVQCKFDRSRAACRAPLEGALSAPSGAPVLWPRG